MMTHCLSRSKKPLRPKLTNSVFSIRKFIEEYDFPEFLIIGQNEFKKFKAKILNIE